MPSAARSRVSGFHGLFTSRVMEGIRRASDHLTSAPHLNNCAVFVGPTPVPLISQNFFHIFHQCTNQVSPLHYLKAGKNVNWAIRLYHSRILMGLMTQIANKTEENAKCLCYWVDTETWKASIQCLHSFRIKIFHYFNDSHTHWNLITVGTWNLQGFLFKSKLFS